MVDDEHEAAVDPAAQYRALAEVVTDAIVTIDPDSTIRFVNEAVEELFGYTPEELRGRSLTVLMDDETAAAHEAGLGRYLDTDDRTLDWDYAELEGRHRDGSPVPLGVSFAEFTDDGERLFVGVVRDISDRRAWETRLTRLTEVSNALVDRTSVSGICRAVHEAAEELFDGEVALALYDGERSELRDERGSSGFDHPNLPPLAGLADLAWEAFATSETLDARAGASADATLPEQTPFERARLEPLGKHGVLIVATATDRPSAVTGGWSLAGVLADRTRGAFERLEREQALQRRNTQLEERNAALDRVNRLNDIIRSLTTELVDATTRAELQSRVCSVLAAADPFEMAWFGVPDPVDEVLAPQASSGPAGVLDERTVPLPEHGTAEDDPVALAADTREVHVQNDLHTNPPFEGWRRAALERGLRAVAAVPVGYDELQYGVLTLYAAEAGAFDQMERTVLAELGGMVGYVINAVERRNALVDEGAIELEYRVTDADLAVIEFVKETGARFEYESVMGDPGGGLRVFFTVHGVAPETTRRFAADASTVEDLRLVTEVDDDAHLYEALIGDEGPIGTLVGMNAVPQSFTAAGGEAWFTVEIPRSVDVRQFTTTLDRLYDDLDLAARRERDRPVQTEQEFRARLETQLTSRQLRALEMAYWNGYFAWPRTSTGEEVAESLGVSQPTFNRHLRSAERNLFELLFDEADG